MADIQIARCAPGVPMGFETLAAFARAEGYDFLNRLQMRWRDNAYLEDEDACVLAAYADGVLAAIGAQTFDEYDPSPAHRRLRHFYVSPQQRRAGVGRTLAGALIHEALDLAPVLHLRATHDASTAFWDAMGFERVADRKDRTHRMTRG
jgi:GNAT superfamily N-acetyltransferase